MVSFILSLITISAGITLVFIIPSFIGSQLNSSLGCQVSHDASNTCTLYNVSRTDCGATNQTNPFCCTWDNITAGCDTWYSDNATAPTAQVTAIGMVVVIIGMIWMIVSVVGG